MTAPSPWVVSDPHGHRHELVRALREQGLVDERGDWSAGESVLWLLGDFFDRGPDGVGVVDVVMRLQRQAADDGGSVGALLGNHEVLALGMYRFGDVTSPESQTRARQVQTMWHVNGGLREDQRRLTDEHLTWLQALPAVALHGDNLLLHSDTMRYLTYGASIEQINAAITATLTGDLESWWDCWDNLTDRYDFVQDDGAEAVRHLTGMLGGSRIVHGHSIIADLVHTQPRLVTSPYLYADGSALAIDGGLYAGGPLLVVNVAQWSTGPS